MSFLGLCRASSLRHASNARQTFVAGGAVRASSGMTRFNGEVCILEQPVNWVDWSKNSGIAWKPPIANKLMHKGQLKLMFVGGPNTREDFHCNNGSEFFYQMKGSMELPTIQRGVRKHVYINEGEVFLLPSRIEHGPQRGAGSMGLVVERAREFGEYDRLRWYTDFNECKAPLWERYFRCGDLESDLVPVVQEYMASEEFKTRVPGANVSPDTHTNTTDDVPDPFNLQAWIDAHHDRLAAGELLNLFPGHPDKETTVLVQGKGAYTHTGFYEYETLFFQIRGTGKVGTTGLDNKTMVEQDLYVLPPRTPFRVEQSADSVGFILFQDPRGNRPLMRKE